MRKGLRSSYPIGLVSQLIKGKDDIVRSVILRTADGEYTRPLSKLIPLELHQEIVPDMQPVDPPNPPVVPTPPPRPRRNAARRAEQFRRDLIEDDLL